MEKVDELTSLQREREEEREKETESEEEKGGHRLETKGEREDSGSEEAQRDRTRSKRQERMGRLRELQLRRVCMYVCVCMSAVSE